MEDLCIPLNRTGYVDQIKPRARLARIAARLPRIFKETFCNIGF